MSGNRNGVTLESLGEQIANLSQHLGQKIDELKNKLDEQSHTIKSLEKELQNEKRERKRDQQLHEIRLFHLEMKFLRNNLILRGVECHHSAKKTNDTITESQDQTNEVVDTILQKLKLDPNIVQFAKRFSTKGERPPIQLILADPPSKGVFFRALAKEQIKGLGVQNEYPLSIRPALQKAEKRAYELRQQIKGTKTRVVVKDGMPRVQYKKPVEKEFSWDSDLNRESLL